MERNCFSFNSQWFSVYRNSCDVRFKIVALFTGKQYFVLKPIKLVFSGRFERIISGDGLFTNINEPNLWVVLSCSFVIINIDIPVGVRESGLWSNILVFTGDFDQQLTGVGDKSISLQMVELEEMQFSLFLTSSGTDVINVVIRVELSGLSLTLNIGVIIELFDKVAFKRNALEANKSNNVELILVGKKPSEYSFVHNKCCSWGVSTNSGTGQHGGLITVIHRLKNG